MERLHRNSENGLLEFYKREMGLSSPRVFAHRVSASQTMIEHIDLYGKLNGHQGCVNTVAFNSTGELLVSGSDDKQIKLWDWAARKLKLSYASGHLDNVFQAKFMPFTDDHKIITSSADCQKCLGFSRPILPLREMENEEINIERDEDENGLCKNCQVRLSQILENGSVETKRLSKHQGRVHSLAVEPGSPHVFYSCGEDGFIQHYDLRSCSATKLFYCSSYAAENNHRSPSISLNSVVIDPRNPNYFAAGGADAYARVYDIRKYQINTSTNEGSPVNTFCPNHLIKADNNVHISALAYSNTSELLISYNDELIYLFQKDVGLGPHPLSSPSEEREKMTESQVYSGHRNSRTVKGVNFFGPNDEYIISGSDCGHIFIWKKKGCELVRMMVGDRHIVNQLESHPSIPLLATCGIEKNIKLWAPSSKDISPLPEDVEEIMESNKSGSDEHSRLSFTPDVIMHVLRLHRRQAHVYIERRYNREDLESDEDEDEDDEREAYLLGFSDGDPPEDGENSRECIIS